MKKLLLLTPLALALSACNLGATAPTPSIPAPAVIANRTAADEQVGVGVELAYKAFRTGLEVAVDAGLLKGDRAARAAKADQTAYSAVLAFRQAYKTANSSGLVTAARNANAAIAQALATLKGA